MKFNGKKFLEVGYHLENFSKVEEYQRFAIGRYYYAAFLMARDFYEDSYEEYEDFESEGYEWTEEDSWDALTDGMYGEMPRNPMEYDAMMDALGF